MIINRLLIIVLYYSVVFKKHVLDCSILTLRRKFKSRPKRVKFNRPKIVKGTQTIYFHKSDEIIVFQIIFRLDPGPSNHLKKIQHFIM